MQEITSLIIDDEPVARGIIENYIMQLSNWAKPVSCNNAIEALDILNKGFTSDVLFLDINMPVVNGIDFYKSLKNPPMVVLTTAYSDFAVDAFELNAIDYLVKPISFERFLKTAQRILEKYAPGSDIAVSKSNKKDFIFLKHNGKMEKVDLEHILYIEGKGDYVNVCTETKNLLINMQLKEMEEYLPADVYIRVHRSYIVNISKIHVVYGNTIEIGKKEIPIGLSYKNDFLKAITDNDHNTLD